MLLRHLAAVVVIVALACCAATTAAGDVHEPSPAPAPARDGSDVDKVLLVFMNHLDVGFNHGETTADKPCLVPPYETHCGWAYSVVNNYFHNFFPAAIATAAALRKRGGTEQFVYTTHPYLLSLFFDCPDHLITELQCPTSAERDALETAIKAGDIVWHAGPFNMEPELMDASMFNYSLSLGITLAKRFGVPQPRMMSQRDVPGMTQAVIPWLLANGVGGVTVGVNSASSPPDVPEAFVWADATGKQSVVAMEHKGGYGWMQGMEPKLTDCALVAPPQAGGKITALCFAFKGDNRGPQNTTEVIADFTAIQKLFPAAAVRAATLNDYYNVLTSARETLPVVTKEIGDTWMYGSASDAHKTAKFRVLTRERRACIDEGRCSGDAEPGLPEFSRMLLKTFEHTWGMDMKFYLHDYSNWSNTEFQAVRGGSNFITSQQSWLEQLSYIDKALTALGSSSPLATRIRAQLAALQATVPSTAGYQPVNKPGVGFACGGFEATVSATGALVGLRSSASDANWAGADRPLGQFKYQTYGPEDYDRFLAQYLYCWPPPLGPEWCYFSTMDFGKPGIAKLPYATRQTMLPKVQQVWSQSAAAASSSQGSCSILVHMTMPCDGVTLFGAPTDVWTSFALSPGSGTVHLDATVQLFNKTATRLPESGWVQFNPAPPPAAAALAQVEPTWFVGKLGEFVPVDAVVNNGSKHLHGVDPCVEGLPSALSSTTSLPKDAWFTVASHDVALAAPGRPSLLNFTNDNPDAATHGVSFNLFNNLYDTNYIMWQPYDGAGPGAQHFRFRFNATLRS